MENSWTVTSSIASGWYLPEGSCGIGFRNPRLTCQGKHLVTELEDREIPATKAIPVGIIFNEQPTSAFKDGFPGERAGRISIRLEAEEEQASLRISDTGVGLPPGFGLLECEGRSWPSGSGDRPDRPSPERPQMIGRPAIARYGSSTFGLRRGSSLKRRLRRRPHPAGPPDMAAEAGLKKAVTWFVVGPAGLEPATDGL